MNYFIANFKQNLTQSDLDTWLKEFDERLVPQSDQKIIISPSFPFLQHFNSSTDLSLAAQDVSPFSSGAHTGQVGAEQIKDYADFCIIGHSETRGSNDIKQVVNKAKKLIENNITPIVCIDLPYLESQIKSLKDASVDPSSLIYAYEPASAIDSDKPEDPLQANQVAQQINQLTSSPNVLYGGSVDDQNVDAFLSQPHINGVLVGSASLDPIKFAKIVSRE